ncbi:hypothetical protein [Paraburkholderia fungorum]
MTLARAKVLELMLVSEWASASRMTLTLALVPVLALWLMSVMPSGSLGRAGENCWVRVTVAFRRS